MRSAKALTNFRPYEREDIYRILPNSSRESVSVEVSDHIERNVWGFQH